MLQCLLEGRVKNNTGIIETLIGRNPNNRKEMAVVTRNGKRAVTHYKVLESFESFTFIEARLKLEELIKSGYIWHHIGHPVVGDPIYGYKKQRFDTKGQLLHARILGFVHPRTGEYMEFEAPLPDYFEIILDKLRK